MGVKLSHTKAFLNFLPQTPSVTLSMSNYSVVRVLWTWPTSTTWLGRRPSESKTKPKWWTPQWFTHWLRPSMEGNRCSVILTGLRNALGLTLEHMYAPILMKDRRNYSNQRLTHRSSGWIKRWDSARGRDTCQIWPTTLGIKSHNGCLTSKTRGTQTFPWSSKTLSKPNVMNKNT